MYTELLSGFSQSKLNIWQKFLEKTGLTPEAIPTQTVLIWDDDDELVATGSRDENILKYLAVDPAHQGEGLLSSVITPLKRSAFEDGIRHLFMYTKPENEGMFSELFFYPVAKTGDILLMEDKKNGIKSFLDSFPDGDSSIKNGCIVMNCNPFTLGHRYLIETAAKECDKLYVFVVSEDKSMFSFADRLEMVKRGTAHIPNVEVLTTGPYLISSATFPTYFLKDRENTGRAQCILDVEIFTKYYAPKFNIQRRFVGTEPICNTTSQYNEALKEFLPQSSIELTEVPRLEISDSIVSASRVRELMKNGEIEKLKEILPQTTFDYLKDKNFV